MATFEFRILTEDDEVGDEEASYQGLAVLEATIAMNIWYFRRHPEDICALACGKVKYNSAEKNIKLMIGEICTAPILIQRGIGLCFDIVAFDVAVRRFEGKTAWPLVIPRGNGIFHVTTEMPGKNGNVVEYDPSAELERRGLAVSYQPKNCTPCPF